MIVYAASAFVSRVVDFFFHSHTLNVGLMTTLEARPIAQQLNNSMVAVVRYYRNYYHYATCVDEEHNIDRYTSYLRVYYPHTKNAVSLLFGPKLFGCPVWVLEIVISLVLHNWVLCVNSSTEHSMRVHNRWQIRVMKTKSHYQTN